MFKNNIMYGEWTEVELRPNKYWVIIGPLAWCRPSGEIVRVTPFFITDFASVPKPLQFIFPRRSDTYDLAAVFHDDLIVKHRAMGIGNRKSSHKVFNEIANYYNTPTWQRRMMYLAVKQFGRLQGVRYSILPSKIDYTKYFGWDLTPTEIYRYHRIVMLANANLSTSSYKLPYLKKSSRKCLTYDEFLANVTTPNSA